MAWPKSVAWPKSQSASHVSESKIVAGISVTTDRRLIDYVPNLDLSFFPSLALVFLFVFLRQVFAALLRLTF